MAAATAGGGGGPAGRGRVPGCRECGRGVEGWGGGLGSRAGACVEIRGGHLDGGELRGGGFESVPLTERNSEGVVPFRETTCAVSGHADGAELHGGCFRVCYSFRDSVKGGQGQGLTEWEGLRLRPMREHSAVENWRRRGNSYVHGTQLPPGMT